MNQKVLLSINDVHKTYQDGMESSHALKGISFDVYEGEILCLLGESGSGKTTTLNVIGGMDSADSGSIIFDGKELVGASKNDLVNYRRNNVGFVFQSYNLMPNLNAKQNLDLIAEIVDNPMDSVEALTLVGLEDKLKSYPSQLSGGQQQRVAIARAIVKRPKLILADEPTAALDYETGKTVLSVFEKVVRDNMTLIMITHNQQIAKMANRIIRLKNGNIDEIIENNNQLSARELVW